MPSSLTPALALLAMDDMEDFGSDLLMLALLGEN
jgi:hypothetical protein